MSDILADGFGMKDPDDDESFQHLVDDVKRINGALRRGANIASGGALPTAYPVGGPFSPNSIARGGGLRASQNLADLEDASEARDNLGLGTAAVANVTQFLQVANNLSDLGSILTAHYNTDGMTTYCDTVTSYTSAGAHTHTWNAATKYAWIIVRGGGGSGGYYSAASGDGASGSAPTYPLYGPGGGGEGETLIIFTTFISAASSTVVVGAGGTAVSSGSFADGTTGTASSISNIHAATITAQGGEGGPGVYVAGTSGPVRNGRGGWSNRLSDCDSYTVIHRVPGQNGVIGTAQTNWSLQGGLYIPRFIYWFGGPGGGTAGSPGAGGAGRAGSASSAGTAGAVYIWERTS